MYVVVARPIELPRFPEWFLPLLTNRHGQYYVALPSPARNTRVFQALSRLRCWLPVDPFLSGWGWVFMSLLPELRSVS